MLVHQKLISIHGVKISYSAVARYIEALKDNEAYVPLECRPGEEAQVDFGYLGVFNRAGNRVKVWVFSMVLSYSRYAYFKIVTSQKVSDFIECHIRAFEYLGGVPRIIKLDNLRAGVTTPDHYEPVFQDQYAAFLAYYGAVTIACRVRYPQQKGKVEASIKYVKNNFLRGHAGRDFDELVAALRDWNDNTCNLRIHGTTRKVPVQMFQQAEKSALLPLPTLRYTVMEVIMRKVSRLSHVSYQYNYYSVPSQYVGKTARLESNGTLLRIYHKDTRIATHAIPAESGTYISMEEHRPENKRLVKKEEYVHRMASIGPYACEFLDRLQQQSPYHWQSMTKGILSLLKNYSADTVNKACRRALRYRSHTYLSIKKICESGLYDYMEPVEERNEYTVEYGHDLSMYDRIVSHL